MASKALTDIPAVAHRLEYLSDAANNEPDEYKFYVREAIKRAADEVVYALPPSTDIGRVIAGLDKLEEAANVFAQGMALGKPSEKNKKEGHVMKRYLDGATFSIAQKEGTEIINRTGYMFATSKRGVHINARYPFVELLWNEMEAWDLRDNSIVFDLGQDIHLTCVFNSKETAQSKDNMLIQCAP